MRKADGAVSPSTSAAPWQPPSFARRGRSARFDSTYTLARGTASGVEVTGIYHYDSQGFLVTKSGAKAIKGLMDLRRAMICYRTTSEANLTDHFAAKKMRFVSFAFERAAEARDTFLAGRCDALTTDLSALYAILAAKPQHAIDYTILRRPSLYAMIEGRNTASPPRTSTRC